jgi:ubiquinone/menaquinone biosynthesis C-methylase UbiE
MKRVERFYDGHAAGYESKFQKPLLARLKRMEEEGILSFLTERLPEQGKLLELGCGTGIFTLPIAMKGCDITATDVSSGMLAQLDEKLRCHGLENVRPVKLDCEREGELPGAGGLDGIYGIGLLEYVESPGRLLAREFRAL